MSSDLSLGSNWLLVRTARPAHLLELGHERWSLRLPGEPDLPVPHALAKTLGWALSEREIANTGGLRAAWLHNAGEGGEPAAEPDWDRLQDILVALELFECRDPSGQIVELVDRKRRYVEERDLSGWERSVSELFERYLFRLDIPAHGAIVELGTARAHNFRRLCEHFGEVRCVGIDVVNYAGHPRILEVDIRQLDPAQAGPVALGFNDLSDWAQSPASKRAGFEYLVPNIVTGGYYVDATLTDELRRTLPLGAFDHVLDVGLFSVYRRR